jgi:hypothetical protein
MSTDINDAAGTVIDLTNKLGATAADIQHTTQAARTARELATSAARHPGRLAVLGGGLLVAASVLAARNRLTPDKRQARQSQLQEAASAQRPL